MVPGFTAATSAVGACIEPIERFTQPVSFTVVSVVCLALSVMVPVPLAPDV